MTSALRKPDNSHPDHLNTPRVITNSTGQAAWRWDHAEPFGSDPANGNPSGLGAFVFNLRLPGQYFDKETNLHYNYYRDYDPSIGRYVQSDPKGLDAGINLYSYVDSNPLSRFDPFGLDWGVCCSDGRKQKTSDDEDRVGASHDFSRNYHAMREAFTIGADKYFHCKANCEAAQRGPAGYRQAERLSNFREFADRATGSPSADSAKDQVANVFGREMGKNSPCGDCRLMCSPHRPPRLSQKY